MIKPAHKPVIAWCLIITGIGVAAALKKWLGVDTTKEGSLAWNIGFLVCFTVVLVQLFSRRTNDD
jgi:hypothetical protein